MFTTVTVVSGLMSLVLLGGGEEEAMADHEFPAKLEEESATIKLAKTQNRRTYFIWVFSCKVRSDCYRKNLSTRLGTEGSFVVSWLATKTAASTLSYLINKAS